MAYNTSDDYCYYDTRNVLLPRCKYVSLTYDIV